MEVAQYHLEKMLPDLNELLKKKAFTEDQVSQIIAMRKKYEYRIHRRICLESDYDQYIEYEKSVEALRTINTKNMEYKLSRCDRSISKRIVALYCRMCYRFPTLVNHMSYIEWLISNKMNNLASQELLKSVQLFPCDPITYLKSAEFEMFVRQNHMGAKSIIMRGIRHLSGDVSIYIGFIKLESAFLNKVAQRQKLLKQEELAFDNEIKDERSEDTNILDYCSVFYIIFKKTLLLPIADVARFSNHLYMIFNDLSKVSSEMSSAVNDIKSKIESECFEMFGKFAFKSKMIESLYSNTSDSFIECAELYESSCDENDMFEFFQKWLLKVEKSEALAQQYIFELIRSGQECAYDIYIYGAGHGLKAALDKLETSDPKEILESNMDWKSILNILNQVDFGSELIPKILDKYAQNSFEESDLLFEALSKLYNNESDIKLVLEYPRLREEDIVIAIQYIYECSDTFGSYLLKVMQENKNEKLWKHIMGVVKPHRQLYLKAAKRFSSLVN
eukprot:NODE_841_length_3770_cov_0.565241.p1 type:complete len:504 gc:universal NODE_841_length_3770_cov_0.565241:3310-1799(-)